ncbi:MAG: hypothetical protein COA78_35890 [Blastopirellula sp.]|nr:MAG: hypothetical protein COA78_35890 [Blastopirellula sp.]
MPASDKIWRNLKTMHLVFAATSLLLLFATLWMFTQDHYRSWKPYQNDFRRIQAETTGFQEEQLKTEQFLYTQIELLKELSISQSSAPPESLVKSFQDEVNADNAFRKQDDYDFSNWEEQLTKLQTAASDLTDIQGANADEDAASEEDNSASEKKYNDALMPFIDDRQNFIARMDSFVKAAKFREDTLLGLRKFKMARLDAARSDFDLGVRDNIPAPELEILKAAYKTVGDKVNELTRDYQHATTHRNALKGLLSEITAAETEVEEKIATSQADLKQLVKARKGHEASWLYGQYSFLGKKINELPILDFMNPSIKIDTIWLPELKQNFSHKMIARFDRCKTCHLGIDKTAPGSATDPYFAAASSKLFTLDTPKNKPEAGANPTLESEYGISLASKGLIEYDAVTISVVRSDSLAATAKRVEVDEEDETAFPSGDTLRAKVTNNEQIGDIFGTPGLMSGDIIEEINGNRILDPKQVERMLLTSFEFGETISIKVRRGLPQPFASHPRLDLFVGSLSPHKIEEVGCTICHDGQGNATDFKWVSHTPNDLKDQHEWKEKYGWFNNHHWTAPMHSERFVESSCIKCHHDVISLEPSDRFPEAPAPKVVQGYNTIRRYGCYGCHEIKGFDGPDKRIGPDLRLEPNYFAAAQSLLVTEGADQLTDEQKEWAELLVYQPELDAVRRQLNNSIKEDSTSKEPVLNSGIHSLGALLKDQDTPGQFRKVGPSLRYVADKLTEDFLYDWVREPKKFRDSTRMPQFFGLWDHLGDDEESQSFEPIEILGIVKYLEKKSQPFEFLPRPADISPSTSEDESKRGKVLFETRGCLACHSHDDFPGGSADQGPELSNIGDKFRGENGEQWLYSWIKEPERYHVRTKMPNLFLDPIEVKDKDGNVIAKTDPAADIAQYLLGSSNGYKVEKVELTPNANNLDRLVKEHLEGAFTVRSADKYLNEGIPESMKANLKGAEVELLGDISTEKKLQYIGRKSLGKYGCYACHDIPGFEDAKPIGAALNDWGRKETSKLAFEHITEYLHHGHGGGSHGDSAHEEHGDHDEHGDNDHEDGHDGDEDHGNEHDAGHDDNHDSDLKHRGQSKTPSDFYMHEIEGHSRIGFIEQKLRAPRSYDYKKAENKKYNDRLRMPQFPFKDDAERESVITFVLGLIAEPPAVQYVYNPKPRQKAIVEGRKVLDKFNCAGCHILEMEKWDLAFEPGFFESQSGAATYPFMEAHFSKEAIEKSTEVDRSGLVHATIVGLPAMSPADALPEIFDQDGDPYDHENEPDWAEYRFQLWEPVLLDGNINAIGMLKRFVPESVIVKRHPAKGGDLAKLLLPRVLEMDETVKGKGNEAWAWVPPPLVGQGSKAQASWMHDFLLDPYLIRPAVVLRMPKFNMTSLEATKLVNYFAAIDNVDYPYEFDNRKRSDYLDRALADYQETLEAAGVKEDSVNPRLADAMKIVVNICTTCHAVGDFTPEGGDKAKAPDLADVYHRLRPDYVKRWIADPSKILPYTSMPVNIKVDKPVSIELKYAEDIQLYHGTSTEQLDALVDLLMNYDKFAKEKSLVEPEVKTAVDAAKVRAEAETKARLEAEAKAKAEATALEATPE